MSKADKPLINLSGVDVLLGGRRVLHDIEWQIRPGENWGLIGGNGSGKTTLLRLIKGEVWPHAKSRGTRVYTLDGEPTKSPIAARRLIRLVTPELGERYRRREWSVTGEEAILTGFDDSAWLAGRASEEQRQTARSLTKRLGIQSLADKSVLEMSTGERIKILIARAVIARPKLLLLDEICENLDEPSRDEVLHFLEALNREHVQIVYTSHRPKDFPPSIDKMVTMEGGRIISENRSARPDSSKDSPVTLSADGQDTGNVLLRLRRCDVYRARHRVLNDINWTMRQGENWLLTGPNGSGKSTFLRLIEGHDYPALGGTIERFGQSGPMDIWEIRQHLGFVGSEIQEAFQYSLSGRDVVYTGYFSTVELYEEPTQEQKRHADEWIARAGLDDLADRDFQTMSFGERRKFLLLRAIVHRPKVLLLDEPTSGLDVEARQSFLKIVEQLMAEGFNAIYTTHRMSEIPKGLNRHLRLESGRIVEPQPA